MKEDVHGLLSYCLPCASHLGGLSKNKETAKIRCQYCVDMVMLLQVPVVVPTAPLLYVLSSGWCIRVLPMVIFWIWQPLLQTHCTTGFPKKSQRTLLSDGSTESLWSISKNGRSSRGWCRKQLMICATVTCKVTEDITGKEHRCDGCHRNSALRLEWNGLKWVSQNPKVRADRHRVRFGSWVLPGAPRIPGRCLHLVCHQCHPALQACPSYPAYSVPFLRYLIDRSVPTSVLF